MRSYVRLCTPVFHIHASCGCSFSDSVSGEKDEVQFKAMFEVIKIMAVLTRHSVRTVWSPFPACSLTQTEDSRQEGWQGRSLPSLVIVTQTQKTAARPLITQLKLESLEGIQVIKGSCMDSKYYKIMNKNWLKT